jgi:hypothetical protein
VKAVKFSNTVGVPITEIGYWADRLRIGKNESSAV